MSKPSAEAFAVADKIYTWGLDRGAVEIDALIAQRVSAERERLVKACHRAVHDVGLPPSEDNLAILQLVACAVVDAIRAPAERPAPPQQKDWRPPGDTTSLTLYPDGPLAQKDLPRRIGVEQRTQETEQPGCGPSEPLPDCMMPLPKR